MPTRDDPLDIEVDDPDDLYEDSFEFSIDENSCIAGPLIGVRGSSVPRAARPADEARWQLDQREEQILTLVERCASVNELLGASGLPESETLEILCDLCARDIVLLERAS